jgi:hypothetical protein
VNPDDEEKARLERFLRIPYWSRTWVLQEVGLASEAVVHWGDYAFPWNSVGLLAMFLRQHCRVLYIELGLFTDLERLTDVYLIFSPFRPLQTFVHVINAARRFQAGNPSDKVFALLSHPTAHTISILSTYPNWHAYESIAVAARALTPDVQARFVISRYIERQGQSKPPMSEMLLPTLIQADYSKTTLEVYLQLAMDQINRTESIEILTAVQHDPRNPKNLFSPSWVPRWNYFVDTPNIGFWSNGSLASANRDAIITPTPTEAKSLVVRGTLLSRITFHTSLLNRSSFGIPTGTPEEVSLKAPQNPIIDTWFRRLADLNPQSYPLLPILSYEENGGTHRVFNRTASNVHQAYMKTWVAGMLTAEHYMDLGNTCAQEYWNRLICDATHGFKNLPSQLMSQWRADHPENVQDWQRYRDAAAHVCNERKFFHTKKGFFGIGPGALKEGDFVAVLLGADVPFVIREVLGVDEMSNEERQRLNLPVPMDRKFLLVGECYVQGLMAGEAVRGREFNRNITLI